MFWKSRDRYEPGTAETAEIARTAPDHLVWAVGDVHGRADLIYPLLDHIWKDILRSAEGLTPTIVFLGDYIDRGAASRTVLDAVIRFGREVPADVVYLKGNHEKLLLDFYDGVDFSERWFTVGGRETVASYGVALPSGELTLEEAEVVRTGLRAQMPREHVDFLRSLTLYFESGDYVLVHAGLKPGVALQDQAERDLLWMRNGHVNDHKMRCTVVHGHTPGLTPRVTDRHIGIDTGAYQTGILTAVRLQDAARRFVSTKVSDGLIVVSDA